MYTNGRVMCQLLRCDWLAEWRYPSRVAQGWVVLTHWRCSSGRPWVLSSTRPRLSPFTFPPHSSSSS
ncbi:hypothetical protein E2C01_013986 [Portunus trituberculatus]|uniref:Uncharacterized protein n=1 Tax=Portunus trituberculatus TaxID=210409 RepID=A0A5B7DIT4_PORTR|nr:hypothetical protein [Portunus trituberculatus]